MKLVGSPGGVSSFTAATTSGTTTTTAVIYGGMVANGTTMQGGCTNTNTTTTCDSCAGLTTFVPCNHTSIHPDLLLRVTIQTDNSTAVTGSPRARWKLSNQTGTSQPAAASTIGANSPITVDIKWSDLCGQSTAASTTCAGSFSTTLQVGLDQSNDTFTEYVSFTLNYRYVDSSTTSTYTACPGVAAATGGQGICDYTVARGDGKVYITDFRASDNSLTTGDGSGMLYSGMVLFYNSTGITTINSGSNSTTFSMKVNGTDTPSISDNRVTGLTNGTQYCFAVGNQDQGGNITMLTPASELVTGNASKYCATPDQVIGLLDDKHCFIATATFGSQMAPEVVTFREFRNKFLLTNEAGKSFVKTYYKYGPIAAQWISENEFLRTLSLSVLWPLLLFVKLSLALGLVPALAVSLIMAVVLQRMISQLLIHRKTMKGEA